MKYLLLYVFGILLLAYSVIMCILQKDISRKVTVSVRRIYYSVYIMVIIFSFDFLGEDFIRLIGKNKLGISEELWFFSISLFIGFVLDLLIISSMSLKEITFAGTKIQIAEDDLVQNVKTQVDLTNELSNKIVSHYNMIQSLGKHVDLIVSKVGNADVDILKEYQEFLGIYFSYQKKNEDEFEDFLSVDVINIEEDVIKSKFKVSKKGYVEFKEQIDSNQSCFMQRLKHQYMFIPYKSLILDYRTILIVLHSKKPVIKVEQYIIISLLQQLEEDIIYRFRQQTAATRKLSGKHFIKSKERSLQRSENFSNCITKLDLVRASRRILNEGGLRPQFVILPEIEDILEKTNKKSKEVIVVIKSGK